MAKYWTENKNGVSQYAGVPPRYRAVCGFCGKEYIDPLRYLRPLMREHLQSRHGVKA